MMPKKSRLSPPILLSILVTAFVLGQPAEAGFASRGFLLADLELLKHLDLTEEQRAAIEKEYEKNRDLLTQKKAKMKKARQMLREARKKEVEPVVVRKRFQDLQNAKRDFEQVRFDMSMSFENKLSREQRNKLEQYRKRKLNR